MRVFKDIAYKSEDACKLDLYLPDGDGFKTIIYFHGGGLEHGDKSAMGDLSHDVVKRDFAFVSVNYRMYGHGGKFPDFLEDAAAAVAFVKVHIREYGGTGKIYVGGSSAGAWITLMLCMDKKYLTNVGVDADTIDGWISDSAQTHSHYNVIHHERGDDTRLERVDEYAPIYYLNDDVSFSKILLLFYEDDIPCRPEENILFYKNVLRFQPNADITAVRLHGGHCHGVNARDDDGEYGFVKEFCAWLKH